MGKVHYIICFNDSEGDKKYSDGSLDGTSKFYLATKFESLEKARLHVSYMENKTECWIEDNIIH